MLKFTPQTASELKISSKKPIDKQMNIFKVYKDELKEKLSHNALERNIVSGVLKHLFENLGFKRSKELECEFKSKANNQIDMIMRSDDKIKVIIEAKIPYINGERNKDMIQSDNYICKAFAQAILYYFGFAFDEKLNLNQNNSVKYIIITDFEHFYLFTRKQFDEFFTKDTHFKDLYNEYKNRKKHKLDLDDDKTGSPADIFYNEAMNYLTSEDYQHFLDSLKTKGQNLFSNPTLTPLHLSIDKVLTNNKEANAFIKCLGRDFLFDVEQDDANDINENFYNKLLYILGLKADEKDNLIVPNEVPNTLYSNIKIKLKGLVRLTNDDEKDRENIMSLLILWLNRILFLKLVEANLMSFNKNEEVKFLNYEKIDSFNALNKLFFDVFAKTHKERCADGMDTKDNFFALPYLNSSLFEVQECEKKLLRITELNDVKITTYETKDLKDESKHKKENFLKYLFDFLNSYNFGSGEECENDTLISPSVLGKVFERFNGYKDGSVYTKSFITSYMCEKSLEKVVLQRFNDTFKWQCENVEALRKRIDRDFDTKEQEFKDTLANIRLCDPAVGSGHFLVSALYELIKIHHTLGLIDGLNSCDLQINNDELELVMKNGEPFKYSRPSTPQDEAHKIQKALFHLKKDIIENNLFGVDINPNSVEICKLRLWIELLKNSYYLMQGDEGFDESYSHNAHQMQTLPNIDINIKCGNSLLSTFVVNDELDENKKPVENSVKWHRQHSKDFSNNFKHAISSYNQLVQEYKEKQGSKAELRKQMQALKDKIKQMLSTNSLEKKFDEELKEFVADYDDKELSEDLKNYASIIFAKFIPNNLIQPLERNPKAKATLKRLEKSYKDLQQTKQNAHNLFEWRFEFPEILDLKADKQDDFGDFIGFDLIIGNPPYIRQEKIPNKEAILEAFKKVKLNSKNKKGQYNTFGDDKTADIYTYFFPKGVSLLKENGILSFIVSNKFCRAGYGWILREYLLDFTQILNIVDLNGVQVFDKDITVDVLIISCAKTKPITTHKFNYAKPELQANKTKQNELKAATKDLSNLTYTAIPQNALTKEAFIFGDNALFELKRKIEKIGTPLKEWDITINYGIKTGYNEAFIIDTAKKDEILAGCDDSDKSRKPFPVIASKAKPCVAIHALTEKERTAQIIKPILRGRDIKRYSYEWAELWIIGTFPALNLDINDYPTLKKYLENFMPRIAQSGEKGCRKKTNNKWFETQDNIAYYEDFRKEKIVYSEIVQEPQFYLDRDNFYAEATSFILTGENLKYLIALLNSKFVAYVFKAFYAGGGLGESGYRYKKAFVEKLPIPKINSSNKNLANEVVNLVDKILEFKKQGKDTSEFEKDIDKLVYKLYNLDSKEIEIIKKG